MNPETLAANVAMFESAANLFGVCGIAIGWMARSALGWLANRIEHAIEQSTERES